MNYQNYDEYMRNLMGCQNMCASMSPYSNMGNMGMEMCSDDLERMYPEVYRVVYPMVCVACDNMRMPVTEEMVDMMTNDIYDRVESDGRINVNITFEVRGNESSNDEIQDNRQMRPRRRNRFLRDLIRILLLRELLRRRQRFPIRPF